MIEKTVLDNLRTSKNLLAFSGGVDSTALFFILAESGVEFDCAIVNYHTRENSDREVEFAQKLCDRHGKKCFVASARLERQNFEAAARTIRYRFFEETIANNGYTTLMTAHQLNDWTEWFLMQLSKGAGFFELCGMRFIEDRKNYQLVRPLLAISKQSLIDFLDARKITPFFDESNNDRAMLRNRFRADYASPLVQNYEDGIRRTLLALQRDRARLETVSSVRRVGDLFAIDLVAADWIHQADLAIKKLGVLLTKNERSLLEVGRDFVASRKIAVAHNDRTVFVAPYIKVAMSKKFREECRVRTIPPIVRGYLFSSGFSPSLLETHSDENAN
ncbi:tRNA(Ile)-lysidine synthase [Campylobacterota bacterium]|nr:tRNA(Ile)-lysidine synthase [Campylobacterota bacterium]